MLKAVPGSTGAERVLIVIAGRGRAYAREIAKIFNLNPPAVHKQLDRMERDGLLASVHQGVMTGRLPFSQAQNLWAAPGSPD